MSTNAPLVVEPGTATGFGQHPPPPRSRFTARPPRPGADLPAPSVALFPNDPTHVEPATARNAPIALAALAFCLGELVATRHWHPPALLALLTLLLLTSAALALVHARRCPLSRSAHAVALLPPLGLWLLVGVLAQHLTPTPDRQLALRPYADDLSRTVVGRVTRVRLLPRPVPLPTTDSEHLWQPDIDPTSEDLDAQPLQLDLALTRVEELTPDTSTLVPIAGGLRLTVLPPRHPATGSGSGKTPSTSALSSTLRCGDLVQIPARLKLPQRYRDPGAFQAADYLLGQGIGLRGSAHVEKLRVLPESAPEATPPAHTFTETLALSPDTNCHLLAAQAWASQRLERVSASAKNAPIPAVLRLSSTDTGMLSAMLFGDRSALTHPLRLGFERTGSFHLFVVSGMHVGLLAGLIYLLLRRVHLRGRRLFSDGIATCLTLPAVFGYALLTGFGAPVQRALFMTAAFLLTRLLFRARSTLNALATAALLVLVWSPHALFEASFQMTCLAILAIGGIAVPLGERGLFAPLFVLRRLPLIRLDASMPPRLAQMRVSARLWTRLLSQGTHPVLGRAALAAVRYSLLLVELVVVGLAAELVMALPMAIFFHRATLFGIPANIVCVPLVGLLMPLALLVFACALISPLLALLPAIPVALLVHGVRYAIAHLSRASLADLRVPPPAAWVALTAVAGVLLCCWAARRSRDLAIAAAVTLPLLTLAVLWPEPLVRTPERLEMTALDVGQGDSILLIGAEGRTMLIDAGGPTGSAQESASATSTYDIGEEVVAPYLWTRRIRQLDTLVLSHAHSDHMGGMPAVLRAFRPRELWLSMPAHAPAFDELLALARAQGTTIRFLQAGDDLRWGEEKIRVLSPESTYQNTADPKNDDSLVLEVSYGQSRVLLEGDAEAPSEQQMAKTGRLAPVTLLKVGHHGSLTSSTPDFLSRVRPQAAVISVGAGNHFGHPRATVLERLAEAHTLTTRTDEFGLVQYVLDRNGQVERVALP